MESDQKRYMRDVFEVLCLENLGFLLEDFAFKIASVEKDSRGSYLVYRNTTTALKACLCPLDGRITFDIYRFVDDKIPKYPAFFDPNDELLVFNFDNLTLLKEGTIVDQKQSDLFNAGSIERIVKDYARLLRKYAPNLLRGDFGISEQIKKIISQRANELKNEQ